MVANKESPASGLCRPAEASSSLVLEAVHLLGDPNLVEVNFPNAGSYTPIPMVLPLKPES